MHPWEDIKRYIKTKNEQNRCNALRGALLLPVSFSRAVFCTGRSCMMIRYALKPSDTSCEAVLDDDDNDDDDNDDDDDDDDDETLRVLIYGFA